MARNNETAHERKIEKREPKTTHDSWWKGC